MRISSQAKKYIFIWAIISIFILILVFGIVALSTPDFSERSPFSQFISFAIAITLVFVLPVSIILYVDRGDQKRLEASGLHEAAKGNDVDSLIRFLNDPDWHIRKDAARALGEIKDKNSAEPLVRSLKDPIADVKINSLWALGELKDPETIKYIKIFLSDPYPQVKNAAAEAFNKFDLETIASETDSNHSADTDHVHEVVKEVIVREIVKVPCKYCETLVDITATKCPSCGAPFSK